MTNQKWQIVLIATLAIVAVGTARPAAGQGMDFSIQSQIIWDGATVYGYMTGYDNSWGCTHVDYSTDAWLSSPTQTQWGGGGGIGSTIDMSFGGQDGTWTFGNVVNFWCSCIQSYSVAGGGSQAPLVRQPSSLSVVTDFFHNPPPSGQLYNRERHYQVRDQFGQPLEKSGMVVSEQYSSPVGNCGIADVVVGDAATNGQGRFKDNYAMSGSPPNPCQTSATQTIKVDNNQVVQFSVIWTYSTVFVD